MDLYVKELLTDGFLTFLWVMCFKKTNISRDISTTRKCKSISNYHYAKN